MNNEEDHPSKRVLLFSIRNNGGINVGDDGMEIEGENSTVNQQYSGTTYYVYYYISV